MRLLFADDHPMFLDAVQAHIERTFHDIDMHVVGSIDAATRMLDDNGDFDLVILDFSMPGMNGTDGLEVLRRDHPDLPIAITSGVANDADVKRVIELGARGFLPKTLTGAAYAGAVRLIAEGGTYVPADTMMAIADGGRNYPNEEGLTPRELDVLKGIAVGKPNKQIARELDISDITVKVHARNVFKKLGVQNRSQAAIAALERKLVRE